MKKCQLGVSSVCSMKTIKRLFFLFLPVFLALLAGAVLILASGEDPIAAYASLLKSGFSCKALEGQCAVVTAMQFATPLILSGLAAAVSIKAGFFSIGQIGQMILGASAAGWLASRFSLPPILHPALAMAFACLIGALWAFIPGLLKTFLGVNEIITTFLFNALAGFAAGIFRSGAVRPSARLLPMIRSTKLNAGFIIALAAALFVFLYFWRMKRGMEIRNAAQEPRFALFAGISRHTPVLRAVLISGALAGLAGAIEVLGVQYHVVSTFSAVSDFDGLIVAFAGHLNPLGIIIFAFLLGGLRTGALIGLQIHSGIPRELGGTLIALILLFAATNRYYGLKSIRSIFTRHPKEKAAAQKKPAA